MKKKSGNIVGGCITGMQPVPDGSKRRKYFGRREYHADFLCLSGR